jgi:hypothetical protein
MGGYEHAIFIDSYLRGTAAGSIKEAEGMEKIEITRNLNNNLNDQYQTQESGGDTQFQPQVSNYNKTYSTRKNTASPLIGR